MKRMDGQLTGAAAAGGCRRRMLCVSWVIIHTNSSWGGTVWNGVWNECTSHLCTGLSALSYTRVWKHLASTPWILPSRSFFSSPENIPFVFESTHLAHPLSVPALDHSGSVEVDSIVSAGKGGTPWRGCEGEISPSNNSQMYCSGGLRSLVFHKLFIAWSTETVFHFIHALWFQLTSLYKPMLMHF